MTSSKKIILGISMVIAAALITGCGKASVTNKKTSTSTKVMPPKLERVPAVEPETQPSEQAVISQLEEIKVEEKPVEKLNKKPVNDEPDLTSLFDPLYKLPIEKVDLQEASVEQVKSIQTLLNQIGYNVGGADGKAGQNTLSGISKFLEDFELPVDQRATGLLLKQLTAVLDNSSGTSIIGTIKSVQTSLQTSGFVVGQSGIADATTRQAILDYQIKEGLVVDGRITNQLLSSLKVKK